MRRVLGVCLTLGCLWTVNADLVRGTDLALTATIGGAFDLEFNPISHDQALSGGGPVIWQVDFAVAVGNLSPGEVGFGNVGFSVSFQNSSDAQNLGWQPYGSSTWAGSSSGSGESPFMLNLDAGPSSDDEHGILVSIAPGISDALDPRALLGQVPGAPDVIGSLFVRDDFLDLASVSVDMAMFASNDVNGKFVNVQKAYGENVLMLPRLGAGPSLLNVSTTNTPPPGIEPPAVPEQYVPPTVIPPPSVIYSPEVPREPAPEPEPIAMDPPLDPSPELPAEEPPAQPEVPESPGSGESGEQPIEMPVIDWPLTTWTWNPGNAVVLIDEVSQFPVTDWTIGLGMEIIRPDEFILLRQPIAYDGDMFLSFMNSGAAVSIGHSFTVLPEPATGLLLTLGTLTVLYRRSRR